jgi:hypothetical protein
MYSVRSTAVLPAVGFPIRKSADHSLFSDSPRLIAAVHVLHRLLVPRHPPCALTILTVIRRSSDPRVVRAPGDTRLLAWLCSFQGPRRGAPRTGARSLKTQQHEAHEQARAPPGPADISVVVGWLSQRGMRRPLPRPLQSWSFPRKEVIQPHLPVRLPCYDFTPVTGPTFDGSLPKGLGHRLRVLLASVV